MGNSYLEAKAKLEKYGQEHLLLFYDKLNPEDKEKLLNQILSVDFEELKKLYEQIGKQEENDIKIEPIDFVDKYKIEKNQYEEYKKIGEEELAEGKLAVITMAGGQGTRLGHEGPKGTFILNIKPEPKSLFQILCETLKKSNEKYGKIIPWYIMTSKENNKQTKEFFEKNDFFGYPEGYINFFIQGELPMLDKNGKILLGEDGLLKLAADGHGGVFEAMFKSGIVEDMQNKGIEWVFVGPIDNPLVNMADEILLGLSKIKKAMAAGKSIIKANPKEKVGVFCKKNGKPSVIEYTEITDEMANATNNNGELLYGESHLNCNMFNINGIKKIGAEKLPYHTAFKKATYIDSKGDLIKGEEPNSYKFESFIFDAFEKLDNMAILRVKREEEFAPVKNKEGVDSPATAIELYNNYMEKIKEKGRK